MRFYYEAVDGSGRRISGEIEAETLEEAQHRLRTWFSSVRSVRLPSRGASFFRRGLSPKTLALFFRQLSLMLSAGISLHRSLEMCMYGDDARLDGILWQLSERVFAGWTVSDAMREHPAAFSDVTIAMVRVGEGTGRLPGSLDRLSDIMMRAFETRERLISNLTYPISVGVIGLIIFAVMATYALPRVEEIFTTLGVPIPLVTSMVITASKVLLHPLTLLLLLLAGVAFMLVLHANAALQLGLLRRLEDRLSEAPLLGPLLEDWRTASVLYQLATVIDAGLPLMEGLNLLSLAAPSPRVRDRIKQARVDLQQGGTLSEAFASHEVISHTGLQMMSAGETAGRLVPMLLQGAAFHEVHMAHRLELVNSLLGPTMLMIVGLVVGVLAVAMLLPFFNVIAAL